MFAVMAKIGVALLGVALGFWVSVLPELEGKTLKKILIGMCALLVALAGVDLLPTLPSPPIP